MSPCDLLTRLILAVVNRGHNPIGLHQDTIGEIERTVFQDIDLDALKHLDIEIAGRQFLNSLPVGSEPRSVQSLGYRDPLGIIRNGDISLSSSWKPL